MRILRVGLIVALLLVVPASTTADQTFEAAVSAATIPHAFDAGLHDIAHQRAVEIVTDFSHSGMRPGTAEVLAWSSGKLDPLAWTLAAWLASPVHLAVLTNAQYELMGCGIHSVGDATYAACVLATSLTPASSELVPPPVVAPALVPTPPVQMLPDAAMVP